MFIIPNKVIQFILWLVISSSLNFSIYYTNILTFQFRYCQQMYDKVFQGHCF